MTTTDISASAFPAAEVSAEAAHCAACSASFGVKFTRYVCGNCRGAFCAGDLIRSERLTIHHSLNPSLSGGHGLCLGCVLDLWGKTNQKIAPAKGILGRLGQGARTTWSKLRAALPGGVGQRKLIEIDESCFEEMNSAKAWAVFRHQKGMTLEKLAEDLMLFARVYAVAQGRSTERSIALSDVYHLVDWARSHPRIPSWAHQVQWSAIESSPSYMAFASDVWHVAQAAMALGSPATLAYHVADRLVDQVGGKGLAAGAYDLFKDKLGLNINVKDALLSYFAGLVILQLLRRREAIS